MPSENQVPSRSEMSATEEAMHRLFSAAIRSRSRITGALYYGLIGALRSHRPIPSRRPPAPAGGSRLSATLSVSCLCARTRPRDPGFQLLTCYHGLPSAGIDYAPPV